MSDIKMDEFSGITVLRLKDKRPIEFILARPITDPKPYNVMCIFFRKIDGATMFYPVNVVCEKIDYENLLSHVMHHVELNPDTTKIETVNGDILWEKSKSGPKLVVDNTNKYL